MKRRLKITKPAHGSVLIFALVLLTLLFAMGAALILFVTQQSRAGANALRNSAGDVIVDSAENHAIQAIRSSVFSFEVVNQDGLFDPSTPPIGLEKREYITSNPQVSSGVAQVNMFRMFEAFTDHWAVAQTASAVNVPGNWMEGHAWLSWNSDLAYCGAATEEPVPANVLRYTEATLSHSAYPNGALRQSFLNGPEHAGQARAWLVNAQANDFYSVALPVVKPPRPSAPRGEYYVWIADLDSKLYAIPQAWGLDPIGNTPQAIAESALRSIRDYGINPPASGWNANGSSYGGMALSDTKITEIWNQATTVPYSNLGDIALRFPTLLFPASTDSSSVKWSYLNTRYGIERYFSIYFDSDESALTTVSEKLDFHSKHNTTLMSLKDHPCAVNVNTASPEILAALLAQVPDFTAQLGYNLAARICARRPFLCRIDFEDFLAAHLPQVFGVALSDAANANQPAGLIYRALAARQVAGISIAEMAEVPEFADPRTCYSVIRDPVKLQERFEFFRKDDATHAPITNAILSIRQLNNLLNSISGMRRALPFEKEAMGSRAVSPYHGIDNPTPVKFATSASLPAPLIADRQYWLRRDTEHYLTVHLTKADAEANANVVALTSNGLGSILRFGWSYYSLDRYMLPNAGDPGTVQDIPDKPFAYTMTTPDGVAHTITPKFEYARLTQAEIADGTGTTTYSVSGAPAGSLAAWRPTCLTGYYEMHLGESDDRQLYEYGGAVPAPVSPVTEIIVISGGLALETPVPTAPEDDVIGSSSTDIVDGPNLICETTIHGPIRAYRHSLDPTPAVDSGRNDGSRGDGDVAWTPRFGFRSRFFAVYTLARPIIDVQGNVPTYGAAQRSEIVYDALRDTVLFRREPATEKRTLGDPTP